MHELDKLSILQLLTLLVRQNSLFHYIWMLAFQSIINITSIMKNTLFTAVSILLISLFVTGCAQEAPQIDYSSLNEDEKTLLSLQDEVNAQIGKLNTELTKSAPDYDQIRFLATETSRIIIQNSSRVETLSGKLENEQIVQETTKVLASSEKLVSKVRELASTLQILQRDLQNAQPDEKPGLEEKIADNKKLLDGYTMRLESAVIRLGELRLFFTEAGESALPTTKEPTRQQLDATI